MREVCSNCGRKHNDAGGTWLPGRSPAWLLTWAIAGLAAGGLAIWLIPPKYEAIAVAQVGQIGQVGQLASAPVEPAIQAVERMRTPAFQLRVAERIGHEEWLADLKRSPKALADAEHLVLNLAKSTSAMGNSALIEVRAKAETADSARRIVDAAIHELASTSTSWPANMLKWPSRRLIECTWIWQLPAKGWPVPRRN